LALALIVAVVVVARPQAVWELLRATEGRGLVLAVGAAAAALVLRGARLALLLPPATLRPLSAVVIAGAAQAAALFVPARAGELALPWLLSRVARREGAAGVGTLLAARALDLAGLGVWAGVALVAVCGLDQPLALVGAGALLLPALLLPRCVAVADRLAQATLGRGGTRARSWALTVHRLAESISVLAQRPGRLAAAAACSLAMWAAVWAMTWLLLAAMGFVWPLPMVVAGSAVASVANLLPLNLIANLGTLEAGWTAAFRALGIPLAEAAATGVAAHLWALVIAAAFGAVAWAVVLVTPGPPSDPRRAAPPDAP
jgi:uncharacterized protein (TIRG00374 family)